MPVAPGLPETEQSRAEYADYILDYIEHTAHTRFVDRIVVKEIFSVTDFARRYHSPRGTADGIIPPAESQSPRAESVFRRREHNSRHRRPNVPYFGAFSLRTGVPGGRLTALGTK
ncbi:MAG: hypothetical protein ACYDBJ_23890 [Aggregatilineales bacterium]